VFLNTTSRGAWLRRYPLGACSSVNIYVLSAINSLPPLPIPNVALPLESVVASQISPVVGSFSSNLAPSRVLVESNSSTLVTSRVVFGVFLNATVAVCPHVRGTVIVSVESTYPLWWENFCYRIHPRW
jgi:hypothetical protein